MDERCFSPLPMARDARSMTSAAVCRSGEIEGFWDPVTQGTLPITPGATGSRVAGAESVRMVSRHLRATGGCATMVG